MELEQKLDGSISGLQRASIFYSGAIMTAGAAWVALDLHQIAKGASSPYNGPMTLFNLGFPAIIFALGASLLYLAYAFNSSCGDETYNEMTRNKSLFRK